MLPPTYQLSRTIQTVHDVWKEWTAGLDNGPAVEALEQSYGASWCPEYKE